MNVNHFVNEQVVAGWLLILSSLVFTVGGMLYTGRAIWKWPAGQTASYLLWERGFVMAAALIVMLGLVLLERLLETAGDRVLSPLGLAIFFTGTVLIITTESFSLGKQDQFYVPIVISIVLTFIGVALFGAALLLTGFLPAWVGWVAIVWSLAWLVILPIARPQDMYYPWLHYVAPLMIGIALLGKV